MSLRYVLNTFVATKIEIQNESIPFWIGQVQDIVKDRKGNVVGLKIHWYELYNWKDAYFGKYAPSYIGSGKRRKAWEDIISVATILHTFSSLTRSSNLSVVDRKAIWQAIH